MASSVAPYLHLSLVGVPCNAITKRLMPLCSLTYSTVVVAKCHLSTGLNMTKLYVCM